MLACRFFVSPVLLLTSLCSATALLPHIQSFINQSPAVVFIYSYCSWYWLSSPPMESRVIFSYFFCFWKLHFHLSKGLRRSWNSRLGSCRRCRCCRWGWRRWSCWCRIPICRWSRRNWKLLIQHWLSTSNQLQEHRQNFKRPLQGLKESTQQSHFQKDLQKWCWIAVLQKLPLSLQLEKWAARCTHVQALNPCR